MKKIKYSAIILLMLLLFLYTGCEMPVSMPERVSLFQDELNENGSGRYLAGHFHEDMTGYSGYQSDTSFDLSPLDQTYDNYSISMTGSPTTHSSGYQYWAGTISNNNYTGRDIMFLFKESGTSWLILAIRIEWNGGANSYEVGNYSSY